MNREITVGIVDNDRFVLPSLKTSIEELSDDMQGIWTTSDGGQAVTNCLTAATRPKVLLADMSMEGVSGISVCRRIRTRIGKVGILDRLLHRQIRREGLAGGRPGHRRQVR